MHKYPSPSYHTVLKLTKALVKVYYYYSLVERCLFNSEVVYSICVLVFMLDGKFSNVVKFVEVGFITNWSAFREGVLVGY